jgi:chorismate mutase
MNDSTPPDAIETIRREIDSVDSSLLALFAQRLHLADRLAVLKGGQADSPLAPAREVALLRRLVAAAQPPLERQSVVDLWRAVIGASLSRQQPIDVVVGGGRGDPGRLYDIARRHFGAQARIKDMVEPQAALQKAAENPGAIVAVTTWPAAPGMGAWWPALSERRFANLHIIAGLPLLAAGSEEPEAALFAASPHEEAGGDISLLLAFDPHHRVQRALAEHGLAGKEVARAEPRVLLRIEGFIAADDPRAAALARSGLDSVRVLGSYARI